MDIKIGKVIVGTVAADNNLEILIPRLSYRVGTDIGKLYSRIYKGKIRVDDTFSPVCINRHIYITGDPAAILQRDIQPNRLAGVYNPVAVIGGAY